MTRGGRWLRPVWRVDVTGADGGGWSGYYRRRWLAVLSAWCAGRATPGGGRVAVVRVYPGTNGF